MSRHHDQSQSADWISDARRRLASWRGKKPETKSGQIWALWPEIKLAVEDGQTLTSVQRWLEVDAGIVIDADTLRSYLSRFRAREAKRQTASVNPAAPVSDSGKQNRQSSETRVTSSVESLAPARTAHRSGSHSDDPMSEARKALNKPRFDIRKVHGDGDPSDRNLI